jgi:hypothetical protein
MNCLIKLWRQSHHAGINLNKNSCLDTLLFADDQVIIATSKDDLLSATYKTLLQTSTWKYPLIQVK